MQQNAKQKNKNAVDRKEGNFLSILFIHLILIFYFVLMTLFFYCCCCICAANNALDLCISSQSATLYAISVAWTNETEYAHNEMADDLCTLNKCRKNVCYRERCAIALRLSLSRLLSSYVSVAWVFSVNFHSAINDVVICCCGWIILLLFRIFFSRCTYLNQFLCFVFFLAYLGMAMVFA